jgi:hypothetical protein
MGKVQLEKSIRNLQHQHMRVIVLVAHQHALAGAPHAMDNVVLLQSLQAGQHRRVFLGLVFLGAKGVIGQRVEADCLRLFGVERFGDDGSAEPSVRNLQNSLLGKRTAWSSASQSP